MTVPETQATNVLEDDAFLAAFLDALIPPSDHMPGAGALDLGPALRKQIADNPMLEKPLSEGLAALRRSAREHDPGGLAALDPQVRHQLVKAVFKQQPALSACPPLLYTLYYQHPRVLQALGEPGGPPFPKGHTIDATEASLLAKLEAKRRG